MSLTDVLGGCVVGFQRVVVDVRPNPGHVVGHLGVDAWSTSSCTSVAVACYS